MAIVRTSFGKMFLIILVKFFLLGLCLGEKETLSSISFRRKNVPLYDKYTSFHDPSIEEPRDYKDAIDYFRHRPNILRSIQYAPLNGEEKTFSDRADIINPPTHQLIENKVHLEPRVIEKSEDHTDVSQTNFLQYIEGHNIAVPLKKEQDNGYSPDVSTEKNKVINPIEYNPSLPTFKHENTEPQRDLVSLKAITKASARIDFNNEQTITTKKYPTKSYQVLTALENSEIEPIFNSYVKVPRLHLNIARAYNFARLPVKASLMGYHKLLSNNPKQAFVPNIDVLLQEKTFLYPVDNNKYTLRT